MKLPCSVVRDLLPLHAEALTEPETSALIKEHFTECDSCAQRLAALREDEPQSVETAQPLKRLKKQLRVRRWCTALLAALCMFVALFTCYYRADSLQYHPWQDGLIRVKGLEAITPEDRLGRSYQLLDKDAAPPHEYTGEALILQTDSSISVWHATVSEADGITTVYLQGASRKRQPQQESASEYGELVLYPAPDRVVYGYTAPQQLLWGTDADGGAEMLPRLVLAYYGLIAAGLALALGAAWLYLRKKPLAPLMRQMFFAPLSWLLAQLLLKGMDATTFFLQWELVCILGLAAAIYGLLTLAWLVWRQHRSAAA